MEESYLGAEAADTQQSKQAFQGTLELVYLEAQPDLFFSP